MNTKFITNKNWKKIHNRFIKSAIDPAGDYKEAINFSYTYNPLTDYYMSSNSTLFESKKAAAMYFWYKKHDATDKFITEYFSEYDRCIDESHPKFNSNYGLYAYTEGGLDLCIKRLSQNCDTRQAMFCINNKEAMSENSIDKLCTNTIQFFIRNNKLEMIVQMRASNFITLLPYDSFMFSVFYFYVYNKLYNEHNMKYLHLGDIHVHAATIHYYIDNMVKLKEHKKYKYFDNLFDNYKDTDFFEKLEETLENCL